MSNFIQPEDPKYEDQIRMFEVDDPAHADLFNAVIQSLVTNDTFLRKLAEQQSLLIEQHTSDMNNPHGTSTEQLELGNVDNTSDENKPVSKAQQEALNAQYTQLTGYTDKAIADLIGGAPETLDTLKEVADAIAENKEVADALDSSIGKKANQAELDTHVGNTNNPHAVTKAHVGLSEVPNVKTNDQTPTFTQASTRDNIKSGEKLSAILGKIMKWFADLKTVAFSGSYKDLSDKPTIPADLTKGGTVNGTLVIANDSYPNSRVELRVDNEGANIHLRDKSGNHYELDTIGPFRMYSIKDGVYRILLQETTEHLMNISGNAATASAVKDVGNSNNVTIAYSKEGLSTADWLAAWNGYELRAISPKNVRNIMGIPSDAVFTDTNTWRGIQDNLASRSTTDSLSANQGRILDAKIIEVKGRLDCNYIEDYIYINHSSCILNHAYCEYGMVAISVDVSPNYVGMNDIFAIVFDKYKPHCDIYGSFGLSSQTDMGKVCSARITTEGVCRIWVKESLNARVCFTFTYPVKYL